MTLHAIRYDVHITDLEHPDRDTWKLHGGHGENWIAQFAQSAVGSMFRGRVVRGERARIDSSLRNDARTASDVSDRHPHKLCLQSQEFFTAKASLVELELEGSEKR